MPSRSPLDLLLALVGWFLLFVTPVSVAVDALAVSAALSDLVLTAALAVPVATWYWRTDRPVGALGAWFFWTVAVGLGVGLVVFIVLGALDAAPPTGSASARALAVGFVAVVYTAAYGLGYRGWAGQLSLRDGRDDHPNG